MLKSVGLEYGESLNTDATDVKKIRPVSAGIIAQVYKTEWRKFIENRHFCVDDAHSRQAAI